MSDAVCFMFDMNLDGEQPQGARNPPVASLHSEGSLPLQSGWESQEHPGLARPREGTWQRSLEVTLPRTEPEDMSPRKLMQGCDLG